MSLEESAFEALDEAAVAGASGTAWEIPDISVVVNSPVDVHCWPDNSPFDHLSVTFMQSDAKREPSAVPFSVSANAASLCSIPLSAVAGKRGNVSQSSSDSIGMQDKLSVVSSEALEHQEADTASPMVKRRTSSSRRLSRAEEELEYGSFTMADLKGTTAARSRKMTEEERRIMLHKRRLRNRASAARSREKRCRTITDLTKDVEELLRTTAQLSEECAGLSAEVKRLQEENKALQKENCCLKNARLV